MKKFIVNEDWETVEVEDTSSFFVLIFKQGTSVAGYIKTYSVDDTVVLAEYESLISQYKGVKFEDPASILVIKVPATGQVKAILEELDAKYKKKRTGQEIGQATFDASVEQCDKASRHLQQLQAREVAH